MRLIFVMVILSICFLSNCGIIRPKPKVVAIYGYSQQMRSGEISRCDCDYLEKNIYLYNDTTFDLYEQRGRITPGFITYSGNWKIVDSTLVAEGNKCTCVNLMGKDINGKDVISVEKRASGFYFKNQSNYYLIHYNEEWERKYGLTIEQLFDAYKQ